MRLVKACILSFIVCQSMLVYADDPAGTFTPVPGSPFTTGSGPYNLAISPDASGNVFAAILNLNANTVSVFQVNQTTGVFTEVLGSPFATGIQPQFIAFSPLASGNLFSAVVNTSSNTLSVFQVDQTTGAFTGVPGSPFAAPAVGAGVAFSPVVSGNLFAATVSFALNNIISIYTVNQITGTFTPVAGSPFATSYSPSSIAFSPLVSGNLFAAVTESNAVHVYNVNQTTGAITEIVGSPFSTGGAQANSVAFSPVISGHLFAAIANVSTNNISVFEVNQTTGAFTPVVGSPFPAGSSTFQVVFSPLALNNLFAAAVNQASNNVNVYTVDPTTGVFTEVAGSPFPTGTTSIGVAFTPFVLGNLFAGITNFGSNNVSVFQVTIPDPTPPNTISPPSNFIGIIKKNRFLNETQYILETSWSSSPSTNIAFYRIYKNGKVVAQISAGSSLTYETSIHSKQEAKAFAITAISTTNIESQFVQIGISNE